jgi:crossover junction endodeoxyribonuclease RusA
MIQIALPWPAKPLQSNARCHWGEKSRATREARRAAAWAATVAKVGCWPKATILIEYYPPSRRGDPQNVPASFKAYLDGIADAMGCDDKAFRVDFPSVFAGTKKGGEVIFRITED